MLHALKTIQPYFNQVKDGSKTFELRKFDRPFKPGDILMLQEFDAKDGIYSGEELQFTISYVLAEATEFGLKKGYCILGLKENPQHT